MILMKRPNSVRLLFTMGIAWAIIAVPALAMTGNDGKAASRSNQDSKKYRGLLGPKSKKIKREGNKTFLWAGPRGVNPSSPEAKWYDFTDSVVPAEELQFGIGKDSILAIDDPMFVSPDDPRLLDLGRNPYDRAEPAPKTADDIPVIGYAYGEDVRAYPIRVLDHHELVNDVLGGKPVTVGW